MKKKMLLFVLLVSGISLSFNTVFTHEKIKGNLPADTIKSLGLQKKGISTFFKAPNGKTYTVKLEMPLEGLEKDVLDCTTDNFHGIARKMPKTTVVTATAENFSVLKAFLSSLIPDNTISPKLHAMTKAQLEQRAPEEKRDIKLTKVFLIAIKREADNDFHMIIGDGKGNFFNTENSGLVASSPQTLKDVRKRVVTFMGGAFCQSQYQTFSPGIPIELEGSLFYDTEHAPGVIGPASARPVTSWEIHPITNIVFK